LDAVVKRQRSPSSVTEEDFPSDVFDADEVKHQRNNFDFEYIKWAATKSLRIPELRKAVKIYKDRHYFNGVIGAEDATIEVDDFRLRGYCYIHEVPYRSKQFFKEYSGVSDDAAGNFSQICISLMDTHTRTVSIVQEQALRDAIDDAITTAVGSRK
jgi:hypothetical protein